MIRYSRWYYHLPGQVYAYGPTSKFFSKESVVREHLRQIWGFKRLPKGIEVWRASK